MHRYTLIKQELDLRRLYPETRGEMVVLPSGSNNEDDEETGAERPGVPPVKKTLLMRHKARPEQCRHCKTFYLEDLNSDMACPFHPGRLPPSSLVVVVMDWCLLPLVVVVARVACRSNRGLAIRSP